MYYHASSVKGIKYLKPQISNHGKPLVYFSVKRENTLVYLSNAVEKYCKETGYTHSGLWKKWGSYGFTQDGVLRLEEYYPNATFDTYKGVSGCIYSTELLSDGQALEEVPFAITSEHIVQVQYCEFISDAYAEIMNAVEKGKIILQKYEDMSLSKLNWIRNCVAGEYRDNLSHDEYRHFLIGKFPFLQS